jgi:hypothetical protein
MTDEGLIRFGKDVRKLTENPFQKQFGRGKSGVEAEETSTEIIITLG